MAVPRPTPLRSTSIRTLADLLGARAADLPDVSVTGVTLDSRAVVGGDLYAALPGARAHGADFVESAAVLGAAAVLTDSDGASRVSAAGVDLPVLVVDSPRAVLGEVSAEIYGTTDLTLRMLGVTGTNGKTTTAYLVHSALTALGAATGLIGTVETRIGDERIDSVRTTPEAPELHGILAVMAQRGLSTCVMEVSSHALAQHRVDGVVYDVALFTNLSQDHLDFHHGMEDYFAAKASLFTPRRSRRALVCVDDAWGRRLASEATVPVHTIATLHAGQSSADGAGHAAGSADWVITVDLADPAAFHLTGPGVDLHLRSRLPGDFNVTNTAMAAAALILLGEDVDAVGAAVLSDPHVPGRMEAVTGPQGSPRALVDYAHTPEAIRAALHALRPSTPGTLVVVTGAGGDRDRDKRHAMGAAAAEVADLVVVTDDNPRSEDPSSIRAALLEGVEAARAGGRHGIRVLAIGDRREAIREAVAAVWAEGGAATVAVVGKGHESGQEIAGVVHPFDDRAELAHALDLAASSATR
ncbi:UDP-N-acetylmuramoyl-L-alanyl-D-glutamate--2,6-diaminopimelate ligase [Ornithinibacter aureus]|uniref:UDP-N-acetylmuramoyl-L-alanyl-D-glutamate--2,6-diaminopimelate ligase n=1 Tax=Ornithinibacter aureus TaxID=622664 RepID=A0ABP8K255_9MICO|nr:UDP-N-acetylmuramoyl-L-alanyl-D-glutamate--2,6-diaminopimelate ligase [Ornithinibacter aureus]KAF0833115.1 UDP-N-acetylmuramoylalanyl-D-glutamate--2,6-diaminopimelate ligase [Ornithinibacter aureus]